VSLVMTLLFGALIAAYLVWTLKKKAQHQAGASHAFREFLEQTGFRIVGAEQAELGEQAKLALTAIGQEGGPTGQEWVRDCAGVEVRHFFKRVQQNGTNYYWCRWSSKLAQQPRIALQVIERRLVGAMVKIDNFVESKSYDWQQELPHRVTLADAELERRFLVYAREPAAAAQVLQGPGVKDMLLACKHVDLDVTADGVRLSDPFRDNMLAALGGGAGLLMAGYDPKTITQAIQTVHERSCWLVATLSRACA
jgi:hypothetical protein